MEFTNLSAEPVGRLHSWTPHDLEAERIVFPPDACPGKSPLPTGTAVLTRQDNCRKFAVSDCGCRMRFLRSEMAARDLDLVHWDRAADLPRANKGGSGDLGGGNHSLDSLEPYDDCPPHFLIHTGSRNEPGHADAFIDDSGRFDTELDRVVRWAANRRAAIHESVIQVFGKLELVLDLSHNTCELLDDGAVVILKGSAHVTPGDLSILPSHLSGDVVLVRATERVAEILFSISHGTGHKMSRSDCEALAHTFDFAAMRQRIMIATGVDDSSLRTDGPFANRDLDECTALIEDYG